ncbi:SNAP receptor use1 [Rhizophlyctis rosea]|nr:SNAP receptor use1 [Rhizophlyctis rosea]
MPTHAEVNLRRLLQKCDSLLAEDGAASRFQFETNINYLKKLLHDVEHDPKRTMDPTRLCEYQRRVDLLVGLLDDQKLVSSAHRTLLQLRNAAAASNKPGRDAVGEVDRVLRIQRNAEDELREMLIEKKAEETTETQQKTPNTLDRKLSLAEAKEELLSSPSLRNRTALRRKNSDATPESRTTITASVDKDTESMLENNRKIQEDMTDELVRMAAALKNNTLTIGEKLQKDKKVLDEASTNLETSVTRLKKEGDRLGKLNVSARTTTWIIWLTILLVCVVFAITFVFMRLFGKKSGK